MPKSTPGILANVIADGMGASRRLLVKASACDSFADFRSDQIVVEQPSTLSSQAEGLFDFIAGDLPLGLRMDRALTEAFPETSRMRKNWADIYFAVQRLADGGMAICTVEPAFWSNEWRMFLGVLLSHGVSFVGAFRFVEQTLPDTSLEPCFAVFSRQPQPDLFVADVSPYSSLVELVDAFLQHRPGKAITDGIAVPVCDFRGFQQLTVEREIRALATQYVAYRHVRLVPDLAAQTSVVLCRLGESLPEKANAIYIPRVGTARVVSQLQDATLKHHNYIQVTLDPKLVLNDYLVIYFGSRLGRLSLQALRQGAVVSRLANASLEDLLLPLPDLVQQRTIVRAHGALIHLEGALADFRSQLSLNPAGANAILESVAAMLRQVDRLSQADEILALIRHGESRTLEFKETLALDVKKGTRENYIENAVLKTLAAFMNTQGGTLLVGVTDSGEPNGISRELDKFFHGSRDDLLKHLKDILKRSIGEAFYPYVDYDTVVVEGAMIIRVDCGAADAPCFLNETEFYVRTNPATDRLDGQKMLEYVQRHFQR